MPHAARADLGVLTGLLIFLGCRQPITVIRHQISSERHQVGCSPGNCDDPRNVVSITYLGISGMLIEFGGHVLMTSPFLSNPPFTTRKRYALEWLGTGPRIKPDSATIERFLPRAADRASAILIGHGHYDHLLDVPYIATHRATTADIFGGPSIRHMLMGDRVLRANSRRLRTIPPKSAGDSNHEGAWFYSSDSAFRFMAIVGGHAPTVKAGELSYLYASARVTTDLDTLPRTASEWKLGEPYAFVIDVLSSSTRRTLFRVYYEDAPSKPPLGFPSASLLAERKIDLAILCAATSSYVEATPDRLLRLLKPGAVMVTHWESFFRSRVLPPALSPATDLPAFRRSLRRSLPKNSGWVVPLPQATVRFRIPERS